MEVDQHNYHDYYNSEEFKNTNLFCIIVYNSGLHLNISQLSCNEDLFALDS